MHGRHPAASDHRPAERQRGGGAGVQQPRAAGPRAHLRLRPGQGHQAAGHPLPALLAAGALHHGVVHAHAAQLLCPDTEVNL